jgi:hypothetical protein
LVIFKILTFFLGLDPAGVLFSSSGPEERLDSSQAKLVDVVHTSGGFLGFKKRIGHRDFYPNGGAWPQPGCKIDYAGNDHKKIRIFVYK